MVPCIAVVFLFLAAMLNSAAMAMPTSAFSSNNNNNNNDDDDDDDMVQTMVHADQARARRLFFIPPHYNSRLSTRSIIASSPSSSVSASVVSASSVGAGAYFVFLQFGSPPQQLPLLLDTGSDLTWLKCDLTTNQTSNSSSSNSACFKPANSSSYQPLSCLSPDCALLSQPPYCQGNRSSPSTCRYEYSYSDGSLSTGDLASETTTLMAANETSTRQINNILMGCSKQASGPALTKASGLLALGRGPFSFLSQIKQSNFSYCLMDIFSPANISSSLAFGASAMATGLPLQFTPLIQNPYLNTFYYVNLERVKIGSKALPIATKRFQIDSSNGYGGTIVDSGTTLASFPNDIYEAFYKRFEAVIPYPRAPPTRGLELCYNVTKIAYAPLFPELFFIFEGNAVLAPPQQNYFTPVGPGIFCLAMTRSIAASNVSVIGNLLQQNFYLHFDLSLNLMGFAPANCSSL